MPPWPTAKAVPNLCRRCQIWAGRKPGYNVQLPCRARGHWQVHRRLSTHHNSHSASDWAGDSFDGRPDAASGFGQVQRHANPTTSPSQVVYDATEFTQMMEGPHNGRTKKQREFVNNPIENSAFSSSDSVGDTLAVDLDGQSGKPRVAEDGNLQGNSEIYQPAQTRTIDEASEALPSVKRGNLWWKPAYKLDLDLRQRPSFAFTPTEYTKGREDNKAAFEGYCDIPDVYIPTDAEQWFSDRPKLSDTWASERKDTVDSGGLPSREELQELGLDPQAKLHTFNFCAHFRKIPVVEYTITPSPGRNAVCVRMPETNVVGYASDKNLGVAELKAFMDFKRAAAEWWAQEQGTLLSLQGIDEVNIDNAPLILSYYRNLQERGLRPMTRVAIGSSRWMSAGGWLRKLSPPGSYTSKLDTRQLAILVATVELIHQDPKLLLLWKEETRHTSGIAPALVEAVRTQISSAAEEALLDVPRILSNVDTLKGYQFKFFGNFFQAETAAEQWLLLEYDTRNDTHLTLQSKTARNENLKQRQEMIEERRKSVNVLDKLPMDNKRKETLAAIKANDQVVITGGTGSGKSTQVPQYIFEEAVRRGDGANCNIVCAQPRRIAAVSLAARVCEERQEELGEVVGYLISGERHLATIGGSITFCTTDVLSLQLERNSEKVFDNISHIIIDEAHILDQSQVRLLAILKNALDQCGATGKSPPKVILMSATLGPTRLDKIRGYLRSRMDGKQAPEIPVLEVPGRGFKVSKSYLQDVLDDIEHNLPEDVLIKLGLSGDSLASTRSALIKLAQIDDVSQAKGWTPLPAEPSVAPSTTAFADSTLDGASLIRWESQREQWQRESQQASTESLAVAKILELCHTTDSGSILVFLPGWRHIEQAALLLEEAQTGETDLKLPPLEILKLHSRQPRALQQAREPAVPGTRRILLSTDIAETSLTFADVRYVVDSGQSRADQSQDQSRTDLWVAEVGRSSMLQRAGRAGRVQEGFYYSLVPKAAVERQDQDDPLTDYISKGELQLACLRAKLYFPQMTISEYFDSWIAPPPSSLIKAATMELITVHKAMDESQRLTEFGRTVAQLSISPANAKAVLLGLGLQCLTPALIIACTNDQNYICETLEFSRVIAAGSSSDHLLQVKAYIHMEEILEERGLERAQEYAAGYGLNMVAFQSLRIKVKRLMKRLVSAGFLRSSLNTPLNLEKRAKDEVTINAIAFLARSTHLSAHVKDYVFRSQQGSNAVLRQESMLVPQDWLPGSKTFNPLTDTLACYDTVVSLSEKSPLPFLSGTSPVSPIMAILFADDVKLLGTEDAEENPDEPSYSEEGNNKGTITFMLNGFIPLQVTTRKHSARKLAKTLMALRAYWQNLAELLLQGLYIRRRPGRSNQSGKSKDRLVMVQLIADLINYEARGVKGPVVLFGQYKNYILGESAKQQRLLKRKQEQEEAEAKRREEMQKLLSRANAEEDWTPVLELDEAAIGDDEIVEEADSALGPLEDFLLDTSGEDHELFAQQLFLDDFVIEEDFEAFEDFDDSSATPSLLLREVEAVQAQATLADSVQENDLFESQTNAAWEARMAKRARKLLDIHGDGGNGNEKAEEVEEDEEAEERRRLLREERRWRMQRSGEMNLDVMLQAKVRRERMKDDKEGRIDLSS